MSSKCASTAAVDKDPADIPIKTDHLGRVCGKEVEHVTGISRSTIDRRRRLGAFPNPIPGTYPLMWMVDDIRAWLRVNRREQWQPWAPPGGWPPSKAA
jgi:predicted DNA-binding transcriptional regulator AlpA